MGTHTYTRTFTRYFTEADVAPLTVELDRLYDDWRHRMEHIDPEVRADGNERLEAARLAIARLTDAVPE